LNDKIRTIDAKVVGITFKNNDGTDRQEILSYVCTGDPVTIKYYEFRGEPAYSVNTEDGDQIGNLSKELAADICMKYKECAFDAHISDMYDFDDGAKTGCRVSIDVYESEDDIPIREYSAPIQKPRVDVDTTADSSSSPPIINDTLNEKTLKRIKTNRILFLLCAFSFAFLGLVTLPIGIIFLILAGIFVMLHHKASIFLKNQK